MSIDTSITHIRPRFQLAVDHPSDEILQKITLMMRKTEKVTGHIVDHHVIIDIPERHRHYWSPQLNFRVEQDEADHRKSVVKGMIGPRPAVWTLFMFIYFSIGAAGFFISAFGFSRWMLGEFSYLVLALPIAVLIMLTAYRAGKTGERLGAEQVEVLKQFVRNAVGTDL